MAHLHSAFHEMNLFREPTDSEISSLLEGTQVVSFYPEDLPQFKANNLYRDEDINLRISALSDYLRNMGISAPIDANDLREMVKSNSPSIIAQTHRIHNGKKPILFILQRPSQRVDSTHSFSSILGVSPFVKRHGLFQHAHRYGLIRHEIGHMIQFMRGITFPDGFDGQYRCELDSDIYAISGLMEQDKNSIFVEQYIYERALGSLAGIASIYWTAPALTYIFQQSANKMAADKEPKPFNVLCSIDEIRFRCALLIFQQAQDDSPDKNVTAFIDRIIKLPSSIIQRCLILNHCGRSHDILQIKTDLDQDDMAALKQLIENHQSIYRSAEFHSQFVDGSIANHLERLAEESHLDDFTQKNVQQIRAAINFYFKPAQSLEWDTRNVPYQQPQPPIM